MRAVLRTQPLQPRERPHPAARGTSESDRRSATAMRSPGKSPLFSLQLLSTCRSTAQFSARGSFSGWTWTLGGLTSPVASV